MHLRTTVSDGVATIVWSTEPVHRPNTMGEASLAEFESAVRALLADSGVRAIIVTSDKSDFIVGADLEMIAAAPAAGRAALFERVRWVQTLLRDLETGGKPVVAAINGTAVGGGLELAMACHARVVANDPSLRLGLPEVRLGLLPGAGGTQRLPRLVGAREALALITQGKTIPPKRALEIGLVHEVVSPAELLDRARHHALALAEPLQPWDRKGFRVPGGDVHSAAGFETFAGANAMISRETWGNYPAPRIAASAVYHGLQLPIEQGLRIEARRFTELAFDPRTRNMIRTLFFNAGRARRLASRPAGVPSRSYRRIGVIGAGLMGHGIAHAAATGGIEVVLLDVSADAAAAGKDRIGRLLAESVRRGQLLDDAGRAALNRVATTADDAELAGCELVIEAVFEDRALKQDVLARAESAIDGDAILASNTSTLPITGLGAPRARPDRFLGLHFFSPVEKMQLVEVIRGEGTSDATVAAALDFVKAVGKTPIVVRDGRGFFTSRVFGTYVNEGIGMLAEGVEPALVENAGRLAGMPMGPLTVADMVNLDLSHRIRRQTRADLGDRYVEHPADRVVDAMVGLGRLGLKVRAGFFDYPGDGDKRLWSELRRHWSPRATQPAANEVATRLLHIQAIETLRCLEEEIVARPEDADVASVLAWGFCPFHGGVASYIDVVGAARLEAECDALADRVGERFRPPALLRRLASERRPLHAA